MKLEDHYPTGEAFEQDLKSAINIAAEADDDYALDFCIDLEEKWQNYGMRMFFSEAQYEYLQKILGA